MTTPLTVQLAEAFGVKTVRKTLRQLVDELVAENMSSVYADERGDPVQGRVHAEQADVIDAEIERRLSLVDEFHGTEATRMRAILETGEDKPWWQK